MNNEEAVQILMLKSEQQVKMINMLNSQLEKSNSEKSELRFQLMAVQNDNMTLRREKEGLHFQLEQLSKQLMNNDSKKDVQIGYSNLVEQTSQQDNRKNDQSQIKQELIEKEYHKLLNENSKVLKTVQDLEGKNQLQAMKIEQLQHQILEIQNEVNFKEALIKKKDNHIQDYERRISHLIDQHQEQIFGKEQQIQKMRDYMLQSYQQNGTENQNHQVEMSKLLFNTGNQNQNANILLKNDQQQKQLQQNYIPPLQQLPLSGERLNTDINELQAQSSGRQQAKQSTANPGQMRQSNEQNTFQLNTVQSEFSSISQPKVSERFKNSDYN
ncbi:unnamed protein product (macronuclear) [Paramecium tetraurelia]|uniref:Uncharacterized protein n=1 Tax=Paramecium tetraurelia TaxID=5888 RepID=A0CMN4_PARTE|nr:uncharacterized protein GSPATT00008530001 [Paramecium tetraurelia]CAK72051.1 unnamed protein product [Paramecium tetraurelia]|eukprot:XP_001439448.1 hypothetical protein (macronuclear) [Paramecium tetraurelia strain d4-2]